MTQRHQPGATGSRAVPPHSGQGIGMTLGHAAERGKLTNRAAAFLELAWRFSGGHARKQRSVEVRRSAFDESGRRGQALRTAASRHMRASCLGRQSRPLGTTRERGLRPGTDDRNPRPMQACDGWRAGRFELVQGGRGLGVEKRLACRAQRHAAYGISPGDEVDLRDGIRTPGNLVPELHRLIRRRPLPKGGRGAQSASLSTWPSSLTA